jgi:hypothetical protein
MGILIAYFVFIASTLAVIVTSWIGVADSGAAGLHLQRVRATQQSYDTSVMVEDPGATSPPATATTASARSNESEHGPGAKLHARAHLAAGRGHDFVADPRLALRGTPPPDGGH